MAKTTPQIPGDRIARMVDVIRIGNRAARAVQQANRRMGIANWYSLRGVLVSDVDPSRANPPPRRSVPDLY